MNKKKTTLLPRLRFPEFSGVEEWEKKELKNVAEVIMGSSPSSSSYNENKIGLPLLQGNADIKNRLSAPRIYTTEVTKECEIDDILISVRAPVGTVAKSLHKACIGRGISAIRANNENSKEFLYQWLFSYESSWLKIAQGGIFDAINRDNIRNLLLPIPQLEEQQKIADCLSSLDDLISAEDKKLEALKAHKKGLMQKLFPCEGKTVPEWRFPEFRGSREWEGKILIDICNMQAGNYVSATEIGEKRASDIFPCYGGNGLRGYTKTFTHNGKYPLIGRQGALCGNVILAEGAFHATEHAVVCIPSQSVVVEWLYYQLLMMNLNQYATSQAQPGLSVKVLEKLHVEVPSATIEQQKIADCLSSIDDLITEQAKRIEVLKWHKKGLMQGLFPSIEEVSE